VFVSNFEQIFDTIPKTENISWTDFVSRYSKHAELVSKTEAKVISPAEWPSGARRQKKRVLRVHFAALDLDKISNDILAQVEKKFDAHCYFIHTTHSHAHVRTTSGLNCVRIYLPLTRPIEIKEWPTFWSHLNAFVGNVLDPACKDAGRVYLLPSMPPGTSTQNYTRAQEGRALDVEQLLRHAPRSESDTDFVSHSALASFAKYLQGKHDPFRKEMGTLLLKVANGEVFAEAGARDATLYKICAQLAIKWPKASPTQIASLFAESLNKMQEASEGAPCIDDVIEKLSRKQDEQTSSLVEVNNADILDAFSGKRDTPYTEEELDGFAREAGIPRSRLNNRWIIRKENTCWLFLDGQYGSPVAVNELVDAARIDLSPAVTSNVSLHRLNSKGQLVPKNERELLHEYSTVAKKTIADLSATKTRYDWVEKTLIEAPCPLRRLTPAFSPEVDQYLRLLGAESQEQLLDWVALVTKLEKPCAALFLYGASGTGKSLLWSGLTRLWTLGAATSLEHVLSDFNDGLKESPLAVADEQIPYSAQKEGGSAQLRSVIQEYSRALKEKFKGHASLLGALRVIITANNKGLLAFKESLNNHDIQAIRVRFLSINVGPEAAQYLVGLGVKRRDRFVLDDEIAKHALWLRDNRQVETNTRFLVQGTDDTFSESLVANARMGSAVLHWLTCYLQNPFKLDAQAECLIRIYEGRLLVTARALVENWETYVTNTDPRIADVHKISEALSGMSDPKKKQLSDATQKPTNYWRIETKYLLRWNRETGFATEDEILSILSKDTAVARHK
jgi:hypothetical protein